MTPALAAAFQTQAESCEVLGSAFTARLCRVLAGALVPGSPLADRLDGWPGDPSSKGANLPLRLTGALHGLRLAGHPGLAAVYPPAAADDAALAATLRDVLLAEAAAIGAILTSAPQTNEVRRSAMLIGIGHWLAAGHRLPLVLSDLGASAGLNLHWDRHELRGPGWRRGPCDPVLSLAPDWRGDPPPDATPVIADRRGCDLNPLHPQADALRALSYIWPDQADRMAMTRAALAIAAAPVDRADAADWLAGRARPVPGHCHLICHTIAWQYFPPSVAARARSTIEAAGVQATEGAPLAWVGMEADRTTPGAALTLRLWPGDVQLELGRADFHGRWVDWRAPALASG